MNANELADWLDNIANLKDWGELTKYYKNRLKNAATMLLQQQSEIEALKTEKTKTVMAEHCTCYKLGYSQLNNYAKVGQKYV